MTQFVVFTGPRIDLEQFEGLNIVPLLDDVVADYVGSSVAEDAKENSWVLRGRCGEPCHELCDDAMIPAQEHGSIKDTELGKLFILCSSSETVVTCFYATESDNLPVYRSERAFLKYVTECLSGKGNTPWEIYAIYEPGS